MINNKQLTILKQKASLLGIPWKWLFNLINFESAGFQPMVQNPYSTAIGLLQWTDPRARDLGFNTSYQMIQLNQSIEEQLELIYRDLKRYAPFPTKQSLYMAVFLPSYRFKEGNSLFPQYIRKINFDIQSPNDYIKKVDSHFNAKSSTAYSYLILGGIIFYGWYKFRK